MATNLPMKEFLQLFFMQDVIINMPEAQFAQYVEYLKANDGKGDFRGNMKTWRDKGLVINDGGTWKRNMQYPGDPGSRATSTSPRVAPSPIQMEDKDWEKLFKEMQKAFRNMDANRDEFKDNKKATEFLDEYFGTNKLFTHTPASPDADNEIQTVLKPYLQRNQAGLEIQLKNWGIIDGDFSFKNLIDSIDKKTYNSNTKIQEKLKQLVQYINYYQYDLAQHGIPNQQFQFIEKGFDSSAISPSKLDYFKRNYQTILLESAKGKVYDVFKNYSPTVSKAVEYAKEKVDYNNPSSKDYVPPKRNDELTPWQRFSDNVGKRWHDHMDKYSKLRGGHVYFSPQAKSIVGALDGAKFKPNDGLGKLLDNADKIKKSLQYKSPTATEHFEWMVKKLGELKSKKMFAGALKNAKQMKALVSELAIMALEDGKDDSKEAVKTAMEVLTVIRYGYTTSNVMDSLKKDDVNIFSDKSLSWNKNEGIKFVATAMDKSIKYAFIGMGYMLNGAGHFIKTRDKKFNAQGSKQNKYQKDLQQRNAAQLDGLERQQRADKSQKRKINTKLNKYRRSGQDEAYWDSQITASNAALQPLLRRQQTFLDHLAHWENDPANQSNPELPMVIQFHEQIVNKQPVTPITVSDSTLQLSIDEILRDLPDIESNRANLSTATDKRQEFQDGTDTVKMLNEQIKARQKKINNWDNNHQDAFKQLMAHWDFLQSGKGRTGENIFRRAINALPISQKGKQAQYDKKDSRINPFTGTTADMSKKELLRLQWMQEHGYQAA